MRENEYRMDGLTIQIQEKRQVLDDSLRELHSIDESIDELKEKNKDMRTTQFE